MSADVALFGRHPRRRPVRPAPLSWRALAAATALAGFTHSPADAQPVSPPSEPARPPGERAPEPFPVGPEQIEALRFRLGEVEAGTRETVAASLIAARAALDQFAEAVAATARHQQEIDASPAALAITRDALAAPAPDPTESIPTGATLADLESLRSQAQAQLEAKRGQLSATEAEPAQRQSRRDAIPGLLGEAQRALEAAEAALSAPPATDTPPLVVEARQLADRAVAQAARARIQALQRELASLDTRRENLQARLDLARRQVGEAEALTRLLESRVNEARRAAAQEAADAARDALLRAASAHPRVQDVLRITQDLAARRAQNPQTGEAGSGELAERAEEDVAAARLSLRSLADDYRSTFERVETIGLTDAMGRLLREKTRRLESPLTLESGMRTDRETRADVLLMLFELRPLEEQWGQPAEVAKSIAEAEAARSPEERTALEDSLRQAMIERLAVYRDLLAELERYQAALGRLDEVNRARLRLLTAYSREIDRTILWVPSHHAIGQRDVAEVGQGLAWVNNGASWRDAVDKPGGLLDDLRERPLTTFVPLLVVLLFALLARPGVSRATDRLHERARRVGTDSFRLTIAALVLGTLVASVGPGFLLALGVVLLGMGDVSAQAHAVGRGLFTAAGMLFAISLLRRLTRRYGLAEVHFRWPEPVTQAIRSKLRWLLPLALATHPLMSAMTLDPDTPGGPAVARLALVTWLTGLALALQRLVSPRGAALSHFLRIGPGGWIDRLRWIWYPLAFGSPLALAAIALLGYVETARELEGRFLDTLGLVLVLILVSALVTRWIALARRRVAMEQARRRREALDVEHAKQLGADANLPTVSGDAHEADLEGLDAQTRQLMRFGVGLSAIFGIWALWVGVLPALGMLERIELWPRLQVIEKPEIERPWDAPDVRTLLVQATSASSAATGASTAPAPATPGAAASAPTALPPVSAAALGSTPASPAPVFTLSSALTVLVLALATLVASRNIPGVIEIVLLQHLPLDRGARYAVTTIFRYMILILGVSATLNAAGIEWGSVQWLAAALTFGLGFGLQEIFANFVSGLIILAERPIRIGDTVTVNGITGNVSKIRMRATTIVDYDKRELVVPNRAFITDSVVNWTLSDPTTRVVIPVGVAYGSDTGLVRDTLLKAGRSCSYLVEGREPAALFRNFGASALEFELRVWTRNVDEAHLARDELLRAIDRAFREAGIEIAYPQQDIRIRQINLPGGEIPPGPVAPRPASPPPSS